MILVQDGTEKEASPGDLIVLSSSNEIIGTVSAINPEKYTETILKDDNDAKLSAIELIDNAKILVTSNSELTIRKHRHCSPKEITESCVQCRLCTRCINNHYFDRVFTTDAKPFGPKCRKCPPAYVNVMVLIIIIVCLLLFINWLINSNVRSVKESNAGTVVRILISHLQLTGLCAHFALNWPTPVTIFFNLASIVQAANQSLCWL